MKKLNFKKHMMTGISYMIPMIVAGGILGALAKGFGGWEVGNYAPEAGANLSLIHIFMCLFLLFFFLTGTSFSCSCL